MKPFLKIFSFHLIVMFCYYFIFLYQLKNARNYDPIAFALKIWIAIIIQFFLAAIFGFIYYQKSKDKIAGKNILLLQIAGVALAAIVLNIFNSLTAS